MSAQSQFNMTARPHYGYWYDGSLAGDYGVLLVDGVGLECVDQEQCGAAQRCLAGHCSRGGTIEESIS